MIRVLLLAGVLAAALTAPVQAQSRATLSGFVTDATSGETLLLANVVLEGTTFGTATNNAGFYTLSGIPAGTYTVVASYIGYREQRTEVTLEAGERRAFDVALAPNDVVLDDVVVTADRAEEEEIKKIGVAQLNTQTIRELPTVLEPDVFRSLQLLPGVKAASDYSSGLYIRGGSPDQTLILLDRTTVYNPSHFFGFFSTFNPDAIKDVRLYKGGYPAEYGGRLGSVVDIYNKDGNRVDTKGSLSVGLLASRAIAEGPYGRGSWMLAVRRSTLEPLLAALQGQDGVPESYYFVDVNGKVNLDASRTDRFSLAFYAGQDDLQLPFVEDGNIDLIYGNRTVSGNWTHLFTDRLFSNFTVTASHYLNEPTFEIGGTPIARRNNVYDVSAKGDFEYIPDERHQFKAGFWAGNFVMRLQDEFDGQETLSERIQTLYGSAYAQHTYEPRTDWTLTAGVRANYFDQGDYLRLEPRLSLEHRPTDAVRLQVGYGRYYQFLTLITSELFSGLDIWLTTDEGVRPAYGDQFVAGVKTQVGRGFNLDAEVYYRDMQDLFELDPFVADAAGLDYAELFHVGEGYAYGTELLLERTRGRLSGFLGYTFGVTRRRFEDFEQFKLYPPKYDRTNEVNLVVNYDLSRRWRVTSVFNYGTGQAYTEPSAQYKLVDNPFGSSVRDVLVADFNEARLPDYHRLDVGFQNRGRFFFDLADYELQLQLINVYSRRNVWFYFFDFEDDNTIDRTEVPQIPFPIPNLSLTLYF